MNAQELKKYGSRKFLIASAAILLSFTALMCDKIPDDKIQFVFFVWIVALGMYGAANVADAKAKLKAMTIAVDTGGSA